MLFSIIKSKGKALACLFLAASVFLGGITADTLTVYATSEELAAEAEARKSLTIQSNEIDNWPIGPQCTGCNSDGCRYRRHPLCQKYK